MKIVFLLMRVCLVMSLFFGGVNVWAWDINVYGDEGTELLDAATENQETEWLYGNATGLWALKYWATGEIVTGKEVISNTGLAACTVVTVALVSGFYVFYVFSASA